MTLRAGSVSVIGCGTMGTAIIRRLAGQGLQLTIFSSTPAKAQQFCDPPNIVLASSIEEALKAETVIVPQSDLAPLEETLRRSQGLKGSKIIVTTNVPQRTARAIGDLVRDKGGAFFWNIFLSSHFDVQAGLATIASSAQQASTCRALDLLAARVVRLDSPSQVLSASMSYICLVHVLCPYVALSVALSEKMGLGIEELFTILEDEEPRFRQLLEGSLSGDSDGDGENAGRIRARELLRSLQAMADEWYGLDASLVDDLTAFVESKGTRVQGIPAWPRDGREGHSPELLIFLLLCAFDMVSSFSRSLAEASGIPSRAYRELVADNLPFGSIFGLPYILCHARWRPRSYLAQVELSVQTLHAEAKILEDSLLKITGRTCIQGFVRLLEKTLGSDLASYMPSFACYYEILDPPRRSAAKQRLIHLHREHLNPCKTDFLLGIGMDLVIGKRAGCYLYDLDDPQEILINLHCNGGVFNFGHRLRDLRDALANSTKDIGNHHLLSEARAELSERLLAIAPKTLRKCVFVPSGSEGIDLALRLARHRTGRSNVISCHKVWHGVTGNTAYTTDAHYRRHYGPTPRSYIHVDAWRLEQIEEHISAAAAVLYEASPSSLDCGPPPEGFFRRLRELCDRQGTVLIIDEVQTGMGRTGRFWYIDDLDFEPDVLVASKGLCGGLVSLAVILITDDLARFFHQEPFMYQSTTAGSELACDLLTRQLQLMNREFLLHVQELGSYFADELEGLRSEFPDLIAAVHQKGLFLSVGFVHESVGELFFSNARRFGLFVMICGFNHRFIQFFPPLNISRAQARLTLFRFRQILRSIQGTWAALSTGRMPPLRVGGPTMRSSGNGDEQRETIAQGMMSRVSVGTTRYPFGRRVRKTNLPLLRSLAIRRGIGPRYCSLMKLYVRKLADLGVPTLYAWPDLRTCDLHQVYIPERRLLVHQLGSSDEERVRLFFKSIVRMTNRCTENGVGLDAVLENWCLTEEDRLCLLDIGQPLLLAEDGRMEAYGLGPVAERAARVLGRSYFRPEFVLGNVLVNMSYSRLQRRWIPMLEQEIEEEAGFRFARGRILGNLALDAVTRTLIRGLWLCCRPSASSQG